MVMNESNRKSTETEEGTAPYLIYPDIDGKISAGTASESEMVQENELLNPDPDSLDRG